MTTTTFEPLGVGYLDTLEKNAYHQGLSGAIAEAVIAASDGCDGPSLTYAAATLCRYGMGVGSATVDLVDQESLGRDRDWARIDGFFVRVQNRYEDFQGWPLEDEAQEAVWVERELRRAVADLLTVYAKFRQADWCGDLIKAADGLAAAARLVKEAFQIQEVS